MAVRISFEEGLRLFQFAPLEELQEKAQKARFEKHPKPYVTFVLDSNPNYTNICDIDCNFCAFYRKKSAKDAYFKTAAETIQEHFEFAKKAGIKTVLLQGGVHEEITIDYLVELVRLAIKNYPDIHPHFFSAIEIWNAAKVSGITVKEALQALWNTGQRTLPGGGAEVLSERVRLAISPKKIGPNGWLDLHTTAHDIGFKTTATMMYGHIEEPLDIMNHLEALRQAQDQTHGFSSFIPWSYKKTKTALRRQVTRWAGKEAYFRILAFSRIYLDNFSHIGSSWFSEGKEIGMESLKYGADDFGGTILEENVHRATDFINKTDHNGMLEMIRKAGFDPAQRDSFYNITRTYENINSVDVPLEGRVHEEDSMPILHL
ncbi:MAG: radical domain protein [Chlamydiia bacterium]|nr:radical domain protein [Chlamydiia bacterium]